MSGEREIVAVDGFLEADIASASSMVGTPER
jgi:hypothetical protein